MSPAAAVAAGVVARHRGERHPLPHRTDPPPAALAASCVLAFCPTPAGAAITAAGMALTWAIGAGVRRVGGEWGDGDSLMLGCVLGATAETPTVLTLVPALGAASLLFIACSHQIGVKTSAMPLAPVISLALIASLAAGGDLMTAARARGRRGQGTLEFILVLPFS